MTLIKFNIAKTRCGYGMPLIAVHVADNIYCITDQLKDALGVPSTFFALDHSDKIKDTYNVRRTQFFGEVPEFVRKLSSKSGTSSNIYFKAKALAIKHFNVMEEFRIITHPFIFIAKVSVNGYGLRHSASQNTGVVMITAQDLYADQQQSFKPTVFYIKSPENLQLYVENESFVQQIPIESLHANWDKSVMSLLLNKAMFPRKSVSVGSANLHQMEKFCEKSLAWNNFERSYFEVRNRYG